MALPMKPLPPHPELERLLAWAKEQPPMTAAELREQRISWTYGNIALSNPRVTREMVERIHDEMYGTPLTGRLGEK